MTSFLFWNVRQKPLQGLIANLARQHNVDILMLAECSIPSDVLVKALNEKNVEYEYAPNIGCEKIEIFTRFSRRFLPAVMEDYRLTIRHLMLPGAIDILLAVTHFPSKTHWKDSSQAAESSVLSNSIRQAEKTVGHSRTILVGDLNMNPFDEGVVNANGLHGVMSKNIARRRVRVIQHREYPFFYNPMWGLLGDSASNTPGTYFYNSTEHTAFFWHMFDQVLIRPDLLDCFDHKDLQILCSDERTSFLSASGLPDAQIASDHLPVLFKLKL